MKKNIHTILFVLFLSFFILTGCQNEDETGVDNGRHELTFTPVTGNENGVETRAIGDDFFTQGGEIDVTITSSDPLLVVSNPYRYVYGSDRIFRGSPGFHFPLNDSYIVELKASWPAAANRPAQFVTDQRDLANYKLADWMTATHSVDLGGIMPTSVPVPLTFVRENIMLDFELVGQNTKGLDIQSLLIELQNNSVSTAYWAYCGNPNGHAELILPSGTSIFAPENYLIGRITVSNNDNYTIIFPQTDLVFEAGKRYLITLTPQGYYMSAYVTIGGFNDVQDEGLGIPFQQPVPNPDGTFTIENPVQLITMSYLIRHYNNPASFNWISRTYNIASGFQMTAEYADQYIPVPTGIFAGSILQDGQPVTSISYMDGAEQKTLELFSNP